MTTLGLLAGLTRLLVEQAPPEEIDALAAEVDLAPSGPEREMLVQAVADTRRVHELLARRQRRERETQALYETARDLTSLRGVDDVLHAIVDRVRCLLGCDSTYIALIDDETGDAYMRVTSGALTPGIESVRQRPGWGVGGQVIQTGQPFATSDYLHDPRIRRDASVAAAVRADGIVGIAGAPMRLGQRVVGALLAADRRERTFEQSEIALLSSLADHASVVITNARLFARSQAATDDLREVNAALSAQRQSLQVASEAHEQLLPLVLTRADLGEFARTLARILNGTVTLVGTNGGVLVSAGAPQGVGLESLLPRGPTAGPPGTAVLPVRAGPDTFGQLVVGRACPLTAADTRTLERAAQTAALLILMQRQTALVELELRGQLVEDLLADRAPDWVAFTRRAERFAVLDPDLPHLVAVVSAPGVPRADLLRAAAGLAAHSGGLAGEHDGTVVLVVPATKAAATARRIAADLRDETGAPVTAGTAGPAVGAPAVRALYPGAARCRRLLLALGRDGDGAALDELGVVGMLLEEATCEQVLGLVARALGPLTDYDTEHAANLLPTVESYFASGQSPPVAARDLGVHVNTVYQRIDRIDQVLGGRHWREPQGALEMQMALELHRLIARHGFPGHDTPRR